MTGKPSMENFISTRDILLSILENVKVSPLLDAGYFHFWMTLFHVWFCGSPSMVIVIIVSMEICFPSLEK